MELSNLKFKVLRMERRVTQKKLEALTGIDRTKLSFFEQGHEFPTDEEIKKMAKALKLPVNTISGCFAKKKLNKNG